MQFTLTQIVMFSNLSKEACLMRVNVHVRWEPQEESMMRTVASFPSERNQGLIEPGGAKKHVEGWWSRNVMRRNTRDSGAN
jgi:hypothetical protein